MSKEEILALIKLISALESWSFSTGQRLPDYLLKNIELALECLTREALK